MTPDLAAVTRLMVIDPEAGIHGAIAVDAASVKTPGPLPNGDKGSPYVTAVRFRLYAEPTVPPQIAIFAVASPTLDDGDDGWYAFTVNDVAEHYFTGAPGVAREDTQAQAIACLDQK